MNNDVRLARLRGAKAAHRLHATMETRARLGNTRGRVDVFNTLDELDVVVMFRPLDGLLGAYLRGTPPGVLITTKRQHSIQRFTAAHELGHAVLSHQPSLDSPDVLRRAAVGQTGPGPAGFASLLQEIEADAFAGEFLLPVWLIGTQAKAQGWSRTHLSQPDTIYQLALRCGASYEATVRSLERNRILSRDSAAAALKTAPKALKKDVKLDADWADPWSDAWIVTEADRGVELCVVAGDLLGIRLKQAAGGGYLWRDVRFSDSLVRLDDSTRLEGEGIGGESERTFVYRAEGAGAAVVQLEQKRPWEAQGVEADFVFDVANRGDGLSTQSKQKLLRSGLAQ